MRSSSVVLVLGWMGACLVACGDDEAGPADTVAETVQDLGVESAQPATSGPDQIDPVAATRDDGTTELRVPEH